LRIRRTTGARQLITKKLVIALPVALALPAVALATSVGNARLTVHTPKHVGKYWVGAASLAAPKAEALQLAVCIQSNGKTIKSSCSYVHGHKAALAAATKKTQASAARTWGWADAAGHMVTAVS
jgi:hypothetical protein